MTVDAFDAPAALRQLIDEGGISEGAIQSLTGIKLEPLRSFVAYGQSETGVTSTPHLFSAEESTRLSILAAQLIEGMSVPDDERLKGILESLTLELHLTPQNIARLTGLDDLDIDDALSDPRFIAAEKKYELAIRVSYLLNTLGRAADR